MPRLKGKKRNQSVLSFDEANHLAKLMSENAIKCREDVSHNDAMSKLINEIADTCKIDEFSYLVLSYFLVKVIEARKLDSSITVTEVINKTFSDKHIWFTPVSAIGCESPNPFYGKFMIGPKLKKKN